MHAVLERDFRGHEVETGEPPEARVVDEASQTLGLDRREERQTRRRRRALASTAAGSGDGAADPGMVPDLKRGPVDLLERTVARRAPRGVMARSARFGDTRSR